MVLAGAAKLVQYSEGWVEASELALLLIPATLTADTGISTCTSLSYTSTALATRYKSLVTSC